MLVRMSEEDPDYEGKWPEGDAMSERVLVPREPTAKMVLAAFDAITNASGEGMIRARWRCMLDAAPAAPQQAEPVAWMAFGGALVHAVTRNAMDPIEAERFDVPLYLHPPAAEVQRLRDAAGGVLAIVESIGRRAFTLDGWMTVQELRRALEGGE